MYNKLKIASIIVLMSFVISLTTVYAEEQCITKQSLPKYEVVGATLKLVQVPVVTQCFTPSEELRPTWNWSNEGFDLDFKHKTSRTVVLTDEFNTTINTFDSRCEIIEKIKDCTRYIPYSDVIVEIRSIATGHLVDVLHSKTTKTGYASLSLEINYPDYNTHDLYMVDIIVINGNESHIETSYFWTIARSDILGASR